MFRTQPKVQNKPGDNLSLSSIPEELLFPDPPGPVQYQPESRPANIISPPVHKFPKLSPDSGQFQPFFSSGSHFISIPRFPRFS